jgi:hypothetical protein
MVASEFIVLNLERSHWSYCFINSKCFCWRKKFKGVRHHQERIWQRWIQLCCFVRTFHKLKSMPPVQQ